MFKKIKKIRTKILVPSIMILFIALMVSGSVASVLSYNSTLHTLNQTMTELITVASTHITTEMQSYKLLVSELASLIVQVEPGKVLDVIEDARERHHFENISITLPNGIVGDSQEDISQKDYFKVPRDQGLVFVSDPIMNADQQSMSVYISAPILVDGRFDGIVFLTLDAKVLTDIVTAISVGKTGNAAMIDKNGTTIAYEDYALVLGGYNTNQMEKSDPKLRKLAALEREVMAGKSGFGAYFYDNLNKFMAYAPIENLNGWGMYITVTQMEFMQGTYNCIWISALIIVLFLLFSSVFLIFLSRSISRPITEVERAASEMAKGNFDVAITYESCDEAGRLANSMRKMIDTTKAIIMDTEWGLEEVSRGNFDIAPHADYIGVYKDMKNALGKIIFGLSQTMLQIKVSTDQVNSGSDQVSSGAQALAQGATEQASAVQLLSAAIEDISQKIKSNAKHAFTACELANTAGNGLIASNAQMAEMKSAMYDIRMSSTEISKIIKTIEDIAFQTNILALNAAVEAARAGSSGKGFAVVAGEVRNLATKSSEAAQRTHALIAGSVRSVECGVMIVEQTASSMLKVLNDAQSMAELITKISNASADQSLAIAQIDVGVEQISAVVQTNSATSEQSAAASEQLNGQTKRMKELVDRFKLNQDALAEMNQ